MARTRLRRKHPILFWKERRGSDCVQAGFLNLAWRLERLGGRFGSKVPFPSTDRYGRKSPLSETRQLTKAASGMVNVPQGSSHIQVTRPDPRWMGGKGGWAD